MRGAGEQSGPALDKSQMGKKGRALGKKFAPKFEEEGRRGGHVKGAACYALHGEKLRLRQEVPLMFFRLGGWGSHGKILSHITTWV